MAHHHPKFILLLLNFLDLCFVHLPMRIQAFGNLIEVVGHVAQQAEHFPDLRQIQLQNVLSVQGHCSHVCRLVPDSERFHLPSNRFCFSLSCLERVLNQSLFFFHPDYLSKLSFLQGCRRGREDVDRSCFEVGRLAKASAIFCKALSRTASILTASCSASPDVSSSRFSPVVRTITALPMMGSPCRSVP